MIEELKPYIMALMVSWTIAGLLFAWNQWKESQAWRLNRRR